MGVKITELTTTTVNDSDYIPVANATDGTRKVLMEDVLASANPTIDTTLDTTSTNAVTNAAVATAIAANTASITENASDIATNTENIATNTSDISELSEDVDELKSDLSEYEQIFTADVDTSVQNWLDEHPEATTTVQDGSLTYKKLVTGTLGFVTPEMFGAVGDGVTDDTDAIQDAIDSDSGYVLFGPGKTYLSGKLVPNDNKVIDLNGSTLYLQDNTELPMFYVIASDTGYSFKVCNGVIDCNMDNNYSVNQSAGTFWITNWDGLIFENLIVKHAYRNIINLYNCENILVRNVQCIDCGLSGDSRHSYGAAFEPTCKNIVVENFTVENMYGYGIHVNQSDNFHIKNCVFDTFTGTNRIGITCTQAKYGVIDNVICNDVTGVGFEINACEQIKINNAYLNNCGGNSITFGDNGTGEYNSYISLENIITENTGSNYAIACNYMTDCVISNSSFDKTLTTTTSVSSDNIQIERCDFGVNLEDYHLASRFKYNDTKFSDFTLSSDIKSISIKPTTISSVAVGETLEVDVTAINSSSRFLGGVIKCLSYMTTNKKQMAVSECPINMINLAVGTLTKIIGSDYRLPTISVDTTNIKVILTNDNDVAVTFIPTIELLSI